MFHSTVILFYSMFIVFVLNVVCFQLTWLTILYKFSIDYRGYGDSYRPKGISNYAQYLLVQDIEEVVSCFESYKII